MAATRSSDSNSPRRRERKGGTEQSPPGFCLAPRVAAPLDVAVTVTRTAAVIAVAIAAAALRYAASRRGWAGRSWRPGRARPRRWRGWSRSSGSRRFGGGGGGGRRRRSRWFGSGCGVRGLNRRRHGDRRGSADDEGGCRVIRAVGGQQDLQAMASRRDVVEADVRRARSREAVIEHVAQLRHATRRRAADGDVHRDRRAGVCAGARRQDRQMRRRSRGWGGARRGIRGRLRRRGGSTRAAAATARRECQHQADAKRSDAEWSDAERSGSQDLRHDAPPRSAGQ